jgi:hypothetical protein
MRPSLWQPPVELICVEEQIVAQIRRAKLFVFLRQHRHELFDEALRTANWQASPSQASEGAHPRLLHNWRWRLSCKRTQASGMTRVIEATVMDRRGPLALDCLDTDQAPISLGTFVAFRKRLIDAEMDRRLIERTIEPGPARTRNLDHEPRRPALDSSPLWGAGRVEDTMNLIGHARKSAHRRGG